MNPRYAQRTDVPVEKSRAEIESTLRRYGADQFVSGWSSDKAVIGFRCAGRQVRFILPLPDRHDKSITHTAVQRSRRSPKSADQAWEQALRQRWRALALAIKAKLETVECGISTFEDEFMAHIVLPDGKTVSEWMRPQLAMAYERHTMPPLISFEEADADG